MNSEQISKYHVNRKQWEEARAARGMPCDTAALDALKMKQIGRVCSCTAFTQHDLDEMLAGFKAEIKPADLNEQIRQQEQKELRLAMLLDDCLRATWEMYELGDAGMANNGERYVAGTCRNIAGKEPDKCTEEELRKVRGALQARVKRMRAKDPEKAARIDASRKQPIANQPF